MSRAPFQVLIIPYRPAQGGAYEYLLLRRADAGYWQPVAGGGEGAESHAEAARREAWEEAGVPQDAPLLALDAMEHIRVTEFKDSPLWGEDVFVIPQHCFGAAVAAGWEPRLSREHVQYGWFTFTEAQRLVRFDGNRTALWELDRRLSGQGPRGAVALERTDQDTGLGAGETAEILFLKLGGSLITDKHTPRRALEDVLARLAGEIAQGWHAHPGLRLVLGHGSGSFGHVAAQKYQTRQGVRTPEEWRGFAEVWREAAALNQVVMRHLHAAGLPALAFPASAGLVSLKGIVASWNIDPLRRALRSGLLPVVYGDVVFDTVLGGTIFSTEDLFAHLAQALRPRQVGLAGLEPGVWADFPACTRLVDRITPATFPEIAGGLGGSAATDVTGGMAGKVAEMLRLVTRFPETEAFIFSGVETGNVARFLSGDLPPGTRVMAG